MDRAVMGYCGQTMFNALVNIDHLKVLALPWEGCPIDLDRSSTG
jgi:hypothetical protein